MKPSIDPLKMLREMFNKPPTPMDLIEHITGDERRIDLTETHTVLKKLDSDEAEVALIRDCLTRAGVAFEETDIAFMIEDGDENLDKYYDTSFTGKYELETKNPDAMRMIQGTADPACRRRASERLF
jgi:hypothetical protein